MLETRRLPGAGGLPPVYTLQPSSSGVPISVLRLGPHLASPAIDHAHAHDFLVVTYVERSGGWIRIADRQWSLHEGDVFVIAPGEVVRVGAVPGPDEAGGVHAWAVFFPPEVLGARAAGSFLGWHTHPLLFPFVGGRAGGAQHLPVPAASRPRWVARLTALDDELRDRREGYREAAPAHLTLLLVDLARLAARSLADAEDAGAEDRSAVPDSLLAQVFRVIEDGYPGRLSAADVARAVRLTPEHLTTVVRRRTGRTVGAWITERRMAEARALLVQTDLPVSRVAGQVGYPDAAYFTRTFRRIHHETPSGWRRAAGRP